MSDYLNSKDIKYVMAVAEHNSITKAANTLYITQPALSSYINKLEERLSVKLFERVGKKFIPTYAGEQIVKYGQKIFVLENELESQLKDIANGMTDRLRIGSVTSGGISFIPPALKKFKGLNPNTKVTITESDPATLKKLLLDGELDLFFASTLQMGDNVDHKVLVRNSLVIYASPDSEIAKSAYKDEKYKYPVVDISACQEHQMLINDSLPLLIQVTDKVFKKLNYVHNPDNIMHTQNQLTNIYMTSLNLGFCISYQNAHLGLILPQNPQMLLIKGAEDEYMESVAYARKGGFETKLIRDFVECYLPDSD